MTRLVEQIIDGSAISGDGNLYLSPSNWVRSLRSRGMQVSKEHSGLLALRVAVVLGAELNTWPAEVAPYKKGFASSFEPAYAQATELCRSIAKQLRREPKATESLLRSTRDINQLLVAGVSATPEEPVGLVEIGYWHELGAMTLHSLVVLAVSTGPHPPTDEADTAARQHALSLVDSLDADFDRLQITIGAAEEMVALLLELADRVGIDRESAANAQRLASVVGDLAKSSPPPPRSFNAAMLDAAQLLHRFDPPLDVVAENISDSDGLPEIMAWERASQLNDVSTSFLSQPLDDDGGKYADSLSLLGQIGEGLTMSESLAAEETFRSRLLQSKTGQAAGRGYLGGIEKLVSQLISKGIPVGIVEGLGWAIGHRSWLGALIKFVIGILV